VRQFLGIIRFTFIAFWSVFAITLSLFLRAITGKRELPLTMARTFWSPMILFFSGAEVTVKGGENLDISKSYIFLSNHQSFLDIPILFRSIPINLHFMGKSELKKMPFIGWFMKSVGMVFVNRKDRTESIKSLQEAGHMIRNGKSLMIFPEGTRSKDDKIGEFKRGSFFIAKEAKVPIVPVYVRNARLVWPVSSFKFKSGPVEIIIGKPVEPLYFKDKSVRVLSQTMFEKVGDLSH